MSDNNPNSGPDHEWDDAGELAWNEFDWEHYLCAQDERIQRYLATYDQLTGHPARIDETARLMGWDREDWSTDPADDPAGPYTLHQNPVFIASRALFTGLRRDLDLIKAVPVTALQLALGGAEGQSLLAIQALDLGDYGLAVSLFKRALRELNNAFAQWTGVTESPGGPEHQPVIMQIVQIRLFDLREIWLRVMNECRDELACPFEDDDDDEE